MAGTGPEALDEDEEGARVRAFLFDADGSDREVKPAELEDLSITDRQLLWVDVDLRDPKGLSRIGSALPIEQESLERLQAPAAPPHLEDFDEYFHVNVRSLAASSNEEEPTEIGCIVARTWVLTAHRGDVDIIESFLDPIKGETQLGRVEGPFFLAILLDWFLSEFFQAVEELERRLDDLDESLIAGDLQHGGEEDLLSEFVRLRRGITVLRRALSSHREIFVTLAQPEFDKVSKSESAERFRQLSDRLEKSIAAAENAREMVMGSLDVMMTRTAQRTNDIMKILTVISAVLLPALVLAGILGMNFRQSFFERADLFWVVVAGMFALGASILSLARIRRWF